MTDSISLAIRAAQQRQNLPTEPPEQVLLKTMKHVEVKTEKLDENNDIN